MNFSKVINLTKSITIKIGPIEDSLSDHKKENLLNEHSETKINYVILANLNVGNFQTTFDYENLPERDLSKIKLNSTDKECFFIHRKENEDNNKKYNDYFVTNNDSIIKPECLISYKYDDVKNCQKCKEIKELIYCLNDDIYLCNECDDNIHKNGKNSNTLKNHKRIPYCEYSIIHHNICKILNHDKPYEIYCPECEELYCIKCQSTDIHSFIHDKNTKMIYINNHASLIDEILIKQNTVII
jgi:hypothetical protein